MNYRHGYHAGNFADMAKHAALLALMRMLRGKEVLNVVDTHAGAGLYDLTDAEFARSKEAEAGIKALLGGEVPDSLKPLADYVRARNARAGFTDRVGLYPGSPVLITEHMTGSDTYIGCELREDDFERLTQAIGSRGKVKTRDGYDWAVREAAVGANLFLIDPPFERFDDYVRITDTLSAIQTASPEARALIWLPLKDLETFDAFLRGLERAGVSDLEVAEIRLHPLDNPMRMNGCVLVAMNAPEGFSEILSAIATDVVTVFGEAGGKARHYALTGK